MTLMRQKCFGTKLITTFDICSAVWCAVNNRFIAFGMCINAVHSHLGKLWDQFHFWNDFCFALLWYGVYSW